MEEVEKFVSFMDAYELKTFIDDIYKATGVTHKYDYEVTFILNLCITYFLIIYMFLTILEGTAQPKKKLAYYINKENE
jgi:hypothetical protein